MHRRRFLHLLGGAITAATTGSSLVVAAQTTDLVQLRPLEISCLTLDEINAIAFTLHGEVFSEHRAHYRARAAQCIRRAVEARWRRGRMGRRS